MAVIIICLLVFAFSPFRGYFSLEYVEALKSQYGDYVILFTMAFTLAGAGLIAVGFPRTVFCIAAGMLYDLWLGLLIGQLAAMLGAYVTYFLSCKMARPLFQAKAKRYAALTSKYNCIHPVILVALLRQAPIPGIITNSLCGVININSKNFLMGSFIGFLPQTIVFCLFGSSVNNAFALRVTIAAVLFLVMILGIKLYLNRKFTFKPV